MRQAILDREPLCRACLKDDRPTIAQEVDHIKPIHKGGGNAPSNLQPLCKACHNTKTLVDKGYRPKLTFGADGWPTGTRG